ncbi:MAG: hypothetical protein GXP30_14470 [Verrucomicrobia bacterium]|nr:hypothetical protein [Verrucomicrobiota bacterium]
MIKVKLDEPVLSRKNTTSKKGRSELEPEKAVENRRRGMIFSVIVGSITVHVIGLVLFGLWTVARYWKQPEAVFEVKKLVKIPPRIPEQKMNLLQHEAMTPKPVFTDKLASIRPIDFALPDLPTVDMNQMLPLDPAELISDQVAGLVGAAGLGNGLGRGLGGAGGRGTGKGLVFFGMKTEGERIVLLFDVSSSVVNKALSAGIPLERVKQETLKLIEGLPITSRFTMIQFTQNFKSFSSELLAATDGNKKAARKWVQNEWVESGTMSGRKVVSNPRGLVAVLEETFRMKPDLIFLISDASFQWRVGGGISDIPYDELKDLLAKLQADLPSPAVIQFAGFQPKSDDVKAWKRLLRRSQGKFQILKAGR